MVRCTRVAKGWTQAELATKTGMTQAYISDMERGIGRTGPTVVTLRRLMTALGDDLIIEAASARMQASELDLEPDRLKIPPVELDRHWKADGLAGAGSWTELADRTAEPTPWRLNLNLGPPNCLWRRTKRRRWNGRRTD